MEQLVQKTAPLLQAVEGKQQRRLGVGRSAVPLILDRFAGRWEIVEYQRNPGAVSFWRRRPKRWRSNSTRSGAAPSMA